MPDLIGYLLLILIGGPLVFGLAGACAIRWLRPGPIDVLADWYVTREMLVRCLPWVEAENPWAWLGEIPKFTDWILPVTPAELPETQGPVMAYRQGIGVTNIRQGWLPNGEEVQP